MKTLTITIPEPETPEEEKATIEFWWGRMLALAALGNPHYIRMIRATAAINSTIAGDAEWKAR